MLAARRSPRFVTVICGALFTFLVALLFRLPTLFFMTSALIGAPLVTYLLAASGLRTVRAERRLPARLWPDEKCEFELRIENDARLPKCLLLIDEELPEGLEGDPEQPCHCVVPMLWGEPFTYRFPVTARARGRYRLPPVLATAVDTFDLFQARRRVGPADEVIVYPRTVPLGADTMTGSKLMGLVPDRRATEGTDFRHTREYRPGDDLRRIHWPSTARQGKPIVVEYEEPTTSNLFLVLDATANGVVGLGKDSTFETAVTVAASLLRHELEHGSSVGLYVDADPPVHFPMTDDRQALLEFFEILATVEANSPRSLGETVLAAAELAPKGTRILVISGAPWPTVGPSPAAAEGEAHEAPRGWLRRGLDWVLGEPDEPELPEPEPDVLADTGQTRQNPAEVLAAFGHLVRRQRSVGYVYLDPRGYRGVPRGVEPAGSFLAALTAVGADVFSVQRGEIANGLRRTL